MDEPRIDTDLYIQYGDILSFQSPSNTELHQHTFFVEYVSEKKIRIIQVTSLEPVVLYLTDTGGFRDESIEVVELLSRAPERGYARQSSLIPPAWVKIEFGGEFPTLIVGEITALDEDQIEITTHPLREVLYIDFSYQGLPEELDIETIMIVDPPPGAVSSIDRAKAFANASERAATMANDAERGERLDIEAERGERLDIDDAGEHEGKEWAEEHSAELDRVAADPTVIDTLHQMYLDANDVVFGPDDEDVMVGQVVEINEQEKVYSVEAQINDFLDELLSTIPNAQRTPSVMDDLHRLLARFRELRRQFSRTDDDTGRVLGPRLRTALHSDKPLLSYMQSLDPRLSNLSWLVPVVSCRRKLYDVADAVVDDVTDAEVVSLADDLHEMQQLQRNYQHNRDLGNTNHDRYMHLQSRMSDSLTPFIVQAQSAQAVQAPIDTVIDNDIWDDSGKIVSTVVHGNDGSIASTRFVAQRFQPGDTMLRPIRVYGKKMFERTPITPSETLQIRSWMALYRSWMEFSRVRLPTTDILRRAAWGSQWPMRFRRLNPRRRIPDVLLIEPGTGTLPRGIAEDALLHGKGDKLFVMEHGAASADHDPDDVAAMIPDTSHLMEYLQRSTSTSLVALIERLEPFLVYTDDLTYAHYKRARHLVHNHVRDMKTRLHTGKQQCDVWRNHRYDHTWSATADTSVSVASLLRENPEFVDHANQVYGITKAKMQPEHRSSSETWSAVLQMDGGRGIALLIRALLLPLQVPVSFLENAAAATRSGVDDMDALEKIKPTDCARRFLAKTYTSLGALQQDNHTDIFYDKDLDDTPYTLLKLYADAKKNQTRDAFEAFLAENLVQKHGCPRNQSLELAHTLIEGKKPVRDGEYAVLSLTPKAKGDTKDDSTDTYITKHTYYKRTRGVWIKDDTTTGLNEQSFVDSNTLFCNLKTSCIKRESVGVCTETKGAAAGRIPTEIARKELAERLTRTMDDVEKTLEDDINLHVQRMTYLTRLRLVQQERYNLYGWSLGKHVQEATGLVSPAAAIRDEMMAEPDFVLRQHHIVSFVDNYARTPMVEALSEDPHWMYCIDTNTRLLPAFLYEMARAFTTGGSAALNRTMDRIIQRQGVASDDGDAIVDKHSGYVIRKIDYVLEDEFDDVTGMRIPTHGDWAATDAQEDAAAAIAAAVAGGTAATATTKLSRVFENTTSETIYRTYVALCYQNMGIEPSEALEDFVIRVASELAATQIRSEPAYEAASRKLEKDKGKKLMPYDTYRRQTLTMLVGATALVGIQTTVPPFHVHKTFPGCVQSFHGFPLTGIEDLSTIVYVSCILSTQDPSMKRKMLEEKLRGILQEQLLPMPEVQERYQTRHEYDRVHGVQRILPELHSLARWRTFLPPLIPLDADALGKTLHAVSKEQADHLLDLMRSGSRDQQTIWANMMGKMMRHGYGIAVAVNAVVNDSNHEALLHSESRVPFLQNACCSQNIRAQESSLTYFEASNPNIRTYRRVIERLATILSNVREASTPPILFDPRDTRQYRTYVPLDHTYSLTSTYAAFIYYGNFDHPDRPIPDDLVGVIPDKPAAAGYPLKGTMEEKIEALKKMGKRYHVDQLDQLLQIVFRRRQTDAAPMPVAAPTVPSMIPAMVDYLDHLDTSASTAIDAPLRERLLPVLAQYRPGTMVHEDSEATRALKNYLQTSNTRMRTETIDFLRRFYGESGAQEWDTWTAANMANMATTDPALDLRRVTQLLRNSIDQMCNVFPSRIVHGAFSAYTAPEHWGLSTKHESDLTAMVEKYTHRLKPFVRDNTLSQVFDHLEAPFRDLTQFLQYIPVQTPIEATVAATVAAQSLSYYGLFDVKTTLLLHWHIWYSVYYLYLQAANDPELVRIDIETRRNRTRQSIREDNEPMQLHAAPVDVGEDVVDVTDRETLWEVDDSRQEMEIRMSTQEELRRRVAELVWTYFTLEREVQFIVDRSYTDITTTIHSFSKAEKKTKTDYLKNMSAEERRVEFQLKENRLGKWGVGTQKSIVAYNKDTYDREMMELQEQLQLLQPTTAAAAAAASGPSEEPTMTTEMDADELARYERAQVDAEYNQEEHNIFQYGEDYTDGNYYGDDDEDEFREE